MGSLSEKVTSELKFKGWEDSIRDETKGGHWKLGGQEGKCPEDEASHSMNRTRLPWLRKGNKEKRLEDVELRLGVGMAWSLFRAVFVYERKWGFIPSV